MIPEKAAHKENKIVAGKRNWLAFFKPKKVEIVSTKGKFQILSGEDSKDNKGITDANEKTSANPLRNIVDNNINNWVFLLIVNWDQIKLKISKVETLIFELFFWFIKYY